jgi:hypothetical protein
MTPPDKTRCKDSPYNWDSHKAACPEHRRALPVHVASQGAAHGDFPQKNGLTDGLGFCERKIRSIDPKTSQTCQIKFPIINM